MTHTTTNPAIPTAALDTSTAYKVEMATEADYEFVQYWNGSANTANAEILNILNQVEGVYQKELKLELEVTFQHAWTDSADPYDTTDAHTLLDQFRDHWNANFASIGYDLAHLWTSRDELTYEDEDGEIKPVGGVAELGTVCRYRSNYSYGFSRKQTYRQSTTLIAAHEIGHNFGVSHPNKEDPPVSSCDGTIMQSGWDPYPDLTFCQFSRDEIRSHVSTYNNCLEAEAAPLTLDPPTNFSAAALGPHRIRLTWSDTNGENARGFRLERKSSANSWQFLAWFWRIRREFIDGSVDPDNTYTYRINAYNEDGETSDWSRTATATTLPLNPAGSGPDLTRWVIPTMANSPGKGGAYYRTKVVLVNFDSPLNLTIRLYGPDGFVRQRKYSVEPRIYYKWPNFLNRIFDYQGAGAVEFSGNAPFTVSAEVYTSSPQGTYTTVVHNGPAPPIPYTSRALSIGVVTVNASDQSQTVTASVFHPDTDEEQRPTFSLPPKGWAQKPITAKGDRGYLLWNIPQQAYLWVVSVDNASNDGTLSFPTPGSE